MIIFTVQSVVLLYNNILYNSVKTLEVAKLETFFFLTFVAKNQ